MLQSHEEGPRVLPRPPCGRPRLPAAGPTMGDPPARLPRAAVLANPAHVRTSVCECIRVCVCICMMLVTFSGIGTLRPVPSHHLCIAVLLQMPADTRILCRAAMATADPILARTNSARRFGAFEKLIKIRQG
jgi:hypothetical protein